MSDAYDSLGVAALRRLVAARGLDASRCLEKSDLLELLRGANASATSNASTSASGASASSASAPPRSAGTAPPRSERLEDLRISELRRLVNERGLDASRCIEKLDIVALLRGASPSSSTNTSSASAPPRTASAPPRTASAPPRSERLEDLRIGELRRLLTLHGVAHDGFVERSEFVDALKTRLSTCPICLDDLDDAPAVRCDHCRTAFHRPCAAQHCLSAADAGGLPPRCPSCPATWPSTAIRYALETDVAKARYNSAVRGLNELRARRASHDAATVEEMKRLGVRACPRCGAWVEKVRGDAFGSHGCLNMTCRCGARFCFQCGRLHVPGRPPPRAARAGISERSPRRRIRRRGVAATRF